MSLGKRPPVYFRAHGKGSVGSRYAAISKADWADVFCDMVEEYMGEGIQGWPCTPEQLMDEAERRLSTLKANNIR